MEFNRFIHLMNKTIRLVKNRHKNGLLRGGEGVERDGKEKERERKRLKYEMPVFEGPIPESR